MTIYVITNEKDGIIAFYNHLEKAKNELKKYTIQHPISKIMGMK